MPSTPGNPGTLSVGSTPASFAMVGSNEKARRGVGSHSQGGAWGQQGKRRVGAILPQRTPVGNVDVVVQGFAAHALRDHAACDKGIHSYTALPGRAVKEYIVEREEYAPTPARTLSRVAVGAWRDTHRLPPRSG